MKFNDSNSNKPVASNGGKLAPNNPAIPLNPTTMGRQALLPQGAQMLAGLAKSYGLDFPTEINMGDPKFQDVTVNYGRVAEVAKANTKALAQMLKHTATLMQGQVKLAEFYAASTQIVTEGKKRIDRATADSFLALAGYNQHTQQLQSKVERKLEAMDARSEAMGELGQGRLKAGLKVIELQKKSGQKRLNDDAEMRERRQELLDSVRAKRQANSEYIRYGHLGDSKAKRKGK